MMRAGAGRGNRVGVKRMTMAALCRTRAASWTSTSRGKGQGTTELRCGEVRVVGEGLVCMGINTITGWTIPPVQSCSRGKGQGSTELLWEGASVVGAPAAGSELSRWKSRIAEERGQDCIVPARPGQDRQISHAALFPPTVSYVASDKKRKGTGYIAVPACGGSLAEAKRAKQKGDKQERERLLDCTTSFPNWVRLRIEADSNTLFFLPLAKL
eukprot:1157593-Pelagomonas_calceolata.AAC.9